MARLTTRKRKRAPRKTYWPGYPYFAKPDGWKPPQQIRLEKLKAEYKARRMQGKGWGNMDVIYIYHRNNMTVSETAEILDTDTDTIGYLLDDIRNDAY